MDRAVVVGEEDGLLFRHVLVEVPRRHDERVLRPPVEPRPRDDAAPAALDDVVDRPADVPVRLCVLTSTQQRCEARDGRHRGPAVQRVRVLDRDPIVGAAVRVLGQRLQRRVRACELVIEDGRVRRVLLLPRRLEAPRAEQTQREVVRLRQRVRAVRVLLVEVRVERLHERHVEAVQPHHRRGPPRCRGRGHVQLGVVTKSPGSM